ncbi:Alpha,alpha-trehalose-phosphate synthase [UDP-forming] [Psychrobacter pasteurii]|uniref:Alpha,alpha-trehalose-phosphate synthase [UDP-forming] n=1 Tax=Psychrobacter pasteurii TaxID=1945520 RepID=A0A1R4EIK6_9GAMM|nr:trehalose-6-phosphate synthase [Psychrobacter pasteurii]SJM38293.1 Alpha,alpha-trehalose-phosphate synthase [UDP-forming] [Psychrobacter pasteurii]
MSRLIVLSNRVKMPDNTPMAGGLAVALQDVLRGSSVVWMGWNGDIIDLPNDSVGNEFRSNKRTALTNTKADLTQADTTLTYITTALTTEQYQKFYCGFSNNVLWPLMHERTDLIHQAPDDYAGYQAVNRLFAKQLKKVIECDDVIWVHDYHFLSIAYHCRRLGIKNRIGFFLHIPFVSLKFWQQLDKSSELIHHFAHYDVLGTQTQEDKANCLEVVQHYLKDFLTDSPLTHYLGDLPINVSHSQQILSITNRSIDTQILLNLDLGVPHSLLIDSYPIGTNVAKIQQQVSHLSSQSAKHPDKRKLVKSADQQIIAVDRIDYSKGLLRRLSAYRDFLEQNPTYQNQLTLLKVACPSRLDLPVYHELCNKVRQEVNDINHQFLHNTHVQKDATESRLAINYSETVLSHEALMMLFWQSDVGWVNSLKDGMNLVAKEYVAAQNPDNPGVLLISRYAGAAEQMKAAVIINPYQPISMTEGLKTALTMPLDERKARYHELIQGLKQENLHVWHQGFLEVLYNHKSYKIDNFDPDKKQLSDS